MSAITPPLHELTARQAAELFALGKTSPWALTEDCLARISKREPMVKAWAHLSPELARSQAMSKDSAPVLGPLHGIPIGIKDVIDTHDQPTQMGSSIFEHHQPKVDASVVALLRSAGAVILGKTVTAEFAGMAPAITTNPHHAGHTPGGSSSGSGAAVADGMVPIAFGTQTGGSVLRPASYCGVFGFKPSFGHINRAGLKFAAESIDTLGWMARSLDDIAMVYGVLTQGCTSPLKARKPLRLGLCQTFMWDLALQETREALDIASSTLQKAGIEIERLELPSELSTLTLARQHINDYERVHALAHEWAHHSSKISPELSASLRRGQALSQAEYLNALRLVEQTRTQTHSWMHGVDAVLTPCVNGEAPQGLSYPGDPSFQALWTLLHLPAIGLPTHKGPKGLPVSIQLIGPRHSDVRLLQHALAVWNILMPGLYSAPLPSP